MKKILITAFEPYGLSGRLRGENASLSVLHGLQQRLSRQEYEYLVLPVSENAPIILDRYADLIRPAAILSLGEDLTQLPNAVRIEPYAHDREATSNPIAGLFVPRLVSTFAQSVRPETKNSTLLSWHCNAVFRAGLKWAAHNENAPVAFAHVAIIGNRARQTEKALEIVAQLNYATQSP